MAEKPAAQGSWDPNRSARPRLQPALQYLCLLNAMGITYHFPPHLLRSSFHLHLPIHTHIKAFPVAHHPVHTARSVLTHTYFSDPSTRISKSVPTVRWCLFDTLLIRPHGARSTRQQPLLYRLTNQFDTLFVRPHGARLATTNFSYSGLEDLGNAGGLFWPCLRFAEPLTFSPRVTLKFARLLVTRATHFALKFFKPVFHLGLIDLVRREKNSERSESLLNNRPVVLWRANLPLRNQNVWLRPSSRGRVVAEPMLSRARQEVPCAWPVFCCGTFAQLAGFYNNAHCELSPLLNTHWRLQERSFIYFGAHQGAANSPVSDRRHDDSREASCARHAWATTARDRVSMTFWGKA
ncbi:hypothetical protein PAPYR_12030 [Paratrimastix pyriformis]|uniref:Uncharacterized protein n=1 Tax=Paratrimastix pyriformis TaxID=342808 RepID=A0ABQ8U2L5_9EUKA|nr:hypothetical protein PAPYR_12030 [Paratrimastix pyriformis]